MAPNGGSLRAWSKTEDPEEFFDYDSDAIGQPATEDQDGGMSSASGSEVDEGSSHEEDEEEDEEKQGSETGGSSEEDEDGAEALPDFGDISFGALAKAQESLTTTTNKRKRPHDSQPQSRQTALSDLRNKLRKTTSTTTETSNKNNKNLRSSHDQNPPSQHRTSKHAPTVQSSKRAVTRARTIFSPPPNTLKSRDPRFDPTITSHNNHLTSKTLDHANKNYSFLTNYRASELQTLRTTLKNNASAPSNKQLPPSQLTDLKRQIASLQAKQSYAETKQAEREVLRQHRTKEREAMKAGQKGQRFHLKRSEVRKEVEKAREQGMGKRAREKLEKNRRKRVEGREKRMMPGFRRSAANAVSLG